MRRGPKPTRWTTGAQTGFAAFFARRSEPLYTAPDDEAAAPLIEVTQAALKWMYTSFGNEPEQVCVATGGSVRSVVIGVTGALVMLGSGQIPGDGTCEQYWVLNEVEVPEGSLHALPRVRGGMGDLKLRLPSGATMWCTCHHCRPWKADDDKTDEPPRPTSPAPPMPPNMPSSPRTAPSQGRTVPTAIDAARVERQTKHDRMRGHLLWLVTSKQISKSKI